MDNLKDKKEYLATLKLEVKQFHPFLERLLPKLPRVKCVEYKHGPNEKGADFIITRDDDTLSTVDYIGIIAKTGKITSDLNDIYKQIDDCKLSRFIEGGKKKITLSEIWIISNESISQNAQEKIFENFSSQKINFIYDERLIKLVDNYMSITWQTIPLDVGDYFSKLNVEITEFEQVNSLLPSKIGTATVCFTATIIKQSLSQYCSVWKLPPT